jgi:adenylate cyclase
MRKLHELVAHPPKRGWILPSWIERVLSVGIASNDPDIVRRQRCVNVIAFAAAADTLSHLVMNSLYNFTGLLPVNIYNVLMLALLLLVPRLHRMGELAGGLGLALLILIGHMFVVWSFGTDTDVHMYFTMVPGGTLLFLGVQHWRVFLIFFALSVAALLISINFAPSEGLLIPGDESFRSSISTQVMLNAIAVNSAMLFYALTAFRHAELQLKDQHDRSESLVQTVMPAQIAERLKLGEQRIADRIEMLSVMFADLIGFTAATHELAPEEVVEFLDGLVRRFDSLCERHAVEKIKTIGDCYMAAAGLDGHTSRGAVAMGRLALDMMQEMKRQPKLGGQTLGLRIGIHSGPATAGVIGDTRFSFDVWGDAVNTASRMESSSEPGCIQVSEAFRQLAGDALAFKERGLTELKGIGASRTYFLLDFHPPLQVRDRPGEQ